MPWSVNVTVAPVTGAPAGEVSSVAASDTLPANVPDAGADGEAGRRGGGA